VHEYRLGVYVCARDVKKVIKEEAMTFRVVCFWTIGWRSVDIIVTVLDCGLLGYPEGNPILAFLFEQAGSSWPAVPYLLSWCVFLFSQRCAWGKLVAHFAAGTFGAGTYGWMAVFAVSAVVNAMAVFGPLTHLFL
jgi:hypothetical protein